jgi:CheY-like chemotaxis protein
VSRGGPGRSTRVEIRWPSAVGEGAVEEPEREAAAAHASRATVLLAEDNEGTRRAVRLLLERNGYRVLAADCGESALLLARQLGSEIDVLLTDMVMPDMSGAELVRALRPEMPHLPVVLMSGYTDHRLREHAGAPGIEHVLLKPSTGAEVREHLERALARAGGPWLMADAS